MSVLDETWEARFGLTNPQVVNTCGGRVVAAIVGCDGADVDGARARLAAQAPAMYRFLRDLEYAGTMGYDAETCCISCKGTPPENSDRRPRDERHMAGCEWLKLMRAAEGATDG